MLLEVYLQKELLMLTKDILLNIDSFKAGIYFIRFENGSKAIKTVKFIKK
jgi:hypothetical protein